MKRPGFAKTSWLRSLKLAVPVQDLIMAHGLPHTRKSHTSSLQRLLSKHRTQPKLLMCHLVSCKLRATAAFPKIISVCHKYQIICKNMTAHKPRVCWACKLYHRRQAAISGSNCITGTPLKSRTLHTCTTAIR